MTSFLWETKRINFLVSKTVRSNCSIIIIWVWKTCFGNKITCHICKGILRKVYKIFNFGCFSFSISYVCVRTPVWVIPEREDPFSFRYSDLLSSPFSMHHTALNSTTSQSAETIIQNSLGHCRCWVGLFAFIEDKYFNLLSLLTETASNSTCGSIA